MLPRTTSRRGHHTASASEEEQWSPGSLMETPSSESVYCLNSEGAEAREPMSRTEQVYVGFLNGELPLRELSLWCAMG
uniref:Uncharacterized protein n=1 Tax=Arundo donax TaxID=35708 RepID=A0A0A9ES60_ARUDO